MKKKKRRSKNACNFSVEDYDIFGHQIHLNFNKKGDTHNTVIGGCLSILLYGFLFYIIMTKIFILANKTDNEEITTIYGIDPDETGTIHY